MVTLLVTSIFAMVPASSQNLIGSMAAPSDSTCQELSTWRIQFVTPMKLHAGEFIRFTWQSDNSYNVNLDSGIVSILWVEGTSVQIDSIGTSPDGEYVRLQIYEDIPATQGVVVALTKIKNPDNPCTLNVLVQTTHSQRAHTPPIKIKPQSLVGTIVGASVVPNALVLVDTFLYSLPATLIGNVAVIIDDVVHIVRGITNTIP